MRRSGDSTVEIGREHMKQQESKRAARKPKCKCGHAKIDHFGKWHNGRCGGPDDIGWFCPCIRFDENMSHARKPAPFKRWIGFNGGTLKYDGVVFSDWPALAELLNRRRVVLTKGRGW